MTTMMEKPQQQTQQRQQRQQQQQQRPSQNEQQQQQKIDRLEQQLYNLSQALQEKEIESKGLKQALRVLQATNKQQRMQQQNQSPKQQQEQRQRVLEYQLDTTKDELISVRKQLEDRTQHTVKLQYQLLEQNDTIQKLKELQSEYQKTITNLEIDIEIHDIHCTNYESHLMELEQNTMNDIFGGASGGNANESKQQKQSEVSDLDPSNNAKELITKYLLDYRALEDQYKQDRYEKSRKIQILEHENEQLQSSIRVLEDRLSSTNKKKYVSFSLNKPTDNIYRKRINYLEKQLAELKLSHDELLKKTQKQLTSSQMTNSRKVSTTTQSSASHNRSDNNIVHLQREIQKRDEKIALLRVEATNYQLRTLHALFENEFNHKKTSKNDIMNDTMTSSDGETLSSADYSSTNTDSQDHHNHQQNNNPSQQIQDLQEILKRRDIELRNERNRFEEREKMLVDQLDIKWNEAISTDCANNLRQIHFFL